MVMINGLDVLSIDPKSCASTKCLLQKIASLNSRMRSQSIFNTAMEFYRKCKVFIYLLVIIII